MQRNVTQDEILTFFIQSYPNLLQLFPFVKD